MTRKRLAAAVAALIVVAVALTAGLASARPTASLSGAGSTFVVPLVTAWTQHYNGASVNYSGIGSGGGISAITARSVDFGASDAPLTPDQASACRGCVQIPWAFSATSIPYNVSGVGYGLKLTGTVLAGIYGGSIKYWDNPAIKKINSGVNLPHEKITPIYRSDGSGTSYNFTDYLSHVSKAWKNKIGKGTQPNFPVGRRGPRQLRRGGQAAEHARRHHLRRRRLLAARTTSRSPRCSTAPASTSCPGIKQIQAAANSIRKLHNSQNAFTAVDPNARAKNAYPICTFSWVIVPAEDRQGGRAEEVHHLGAEQGPVLRAEAALRPGPQGGQAGRPEDPGQGP